jgi:hypothetical protein
MEWYIADIIAPIDFPMGRVTYGKVLFSLACQHINIWLYPSQGMVTMHRDQAKRVLKSRRDKNNKLIKWEG